MPDYQLDEARAQAPLDERPYHQWTLPDGQPWLAFRRCPGGFLLRFPGLADFRVSDDGLEVACAPVPGTAAETVDHLYLNQVLPLMLGRQGKLVFHASAVALGEGAVAFVGASGRGKSTLATGFAAAGAGFLADDGMVLEEAEGRWRVQPGHPSVRLRDDSRAALLGSDAGHVGGVRFAAKMRMPAQARLRHVDRTLPLRAAYFLGPGEARTVSLDRLSGAEAMREWVGHAFVLDVEDRPGLAAHFAGLAGLAEAVPCYRLDYPRRFEELERVRKLILEHAGAGELRP